MPGLQQCGPEEGFSRLPGERSSRKTPELASARFCWGNEGPSLIVGKAATQGVHWTQLSEGSQSTKEVVLPQAHSWIPGRYARRSFRLRHFRRFQFTTSERLFP